MSERRPRAFVAVAGMLAVFSAIVGAVAAGIAIPLDGRLADDLYEVFSRHAILHRAEWFSARAGDVRAVALVLAVVILGLILAKRLRHAAWVLCAAAAASATRTVASYVCAA